MGLVMAKKAKTSRKALGAASAADALGDASGTLKATARRRPKRTGKGKGVAVPERKAATRAPEAKDETRWLGNLAKTLSPRKASRVKVRMGRLERLEIAIDEVRLGGRISPRTRKLQMSGVAKMAQKVIEEAGEVAIEGIQGNKAGLIGESVDLLYNLVVLLSASGVTLAQVWDEMDRRELALGMAEKLPKAVDPDP